MADLLPPTPVGVPPGHSFWNDWYERLRTLVNSGSISVLWSSLNFAGSNLTDLATREHNSLQSFQGGGAGERYHLSAAEHTALTINFAASSRAQVEGTLIAGTNVTITPAGAGATRTLTIASTGGGGGGSTVVKLSADQAFSTTTIADVTNMPVIALAANTDYIIELIGSFQSAATTTGIGLCLNVGGTVTRISGSVVHPVSATAPGSCSQEANNAVTGATTGVRAIGVPVSLQGLWHVRMGATGGNAQLRCRSEIAASAVTLHAGTVLRATVL
jgi:hypothetical protein